MPSEDTISAEVQKEQKETQKETLIEIRKLVQAGQGSAKQRLQLVQNMSKIEKSNRTLGGDLSKNVKDMKDGIQTTVDGMINETFGPLGGVVSSFTTGWFKRAEDNKDNLNANEAQVEAAQSTLEEIKGGKVEATAAASALQNEQRKTTKAVRSLPSAETQEEEERESDKQHAELLAGLEDLKLKSIKDVGDDGGFFAGLGTIASILGGIALGLTAPGLFTNMSQWAKAFDNFKVKFPNFTTKIGGWWDELAGSFKKIKFPDLPKLPDFPKIKWPDLPKIKMPDFPKFPDFPKINWPKLPDMPKIPEDFLPKFDTFKAGFREFFNIPAKEIDATKDALKVLNAADFGYDAVRISAETFGDTTKLVARDAAGRFARVSDELKAAMVLADEGGDAGKVAARARSFMGIELPGFMQKSIDKIDEVAKGADTAVDASKMGGLASKVGGIAKFLTVGVAGRALSIAGNPVFDVIAMGKDVFDIASAVTDDDVKTSVKKEDIGALVGGFIGGAIGIVGGPAGVALGMGLGNMAGEFIGKAMDDPEIVGAIAKVEENLVAERTGLKEEIADLGAQIDTATKANNAEILKFQKEIAEAKAAGNATEAAELTRQLEERKAANKEKIDALIVEKDARIARDEQLAAEQEKMSDPKGEFMMAKTALAEAEKKANEIVAKKAKLELDIAAAEERGDAGRVAYLTKILTQTEKEFDEAETAYEESAEKLRVEAQKVSGQLGAASNSMFDKIATEGGFFGSMLSMVGFGIKEGEGKKEYLEEQIQNIGKQIEAQKAEIEGGDDFEWTLTGLKNRKGLIAELERDREHLTKQLGAIGTAKGKAKGAIIVNRPSYLPSSGVVVGEHASWSGRGAARGAVGGPIPLDGGPEAIVPLGSDRAGAFFDPIAQRMGQNLNAQMYDRIAGTAGGQGTGTNVVTTDSSVNTTVINEAPRFTNANGDDRIGASDFVRRIS